MGVLLVLFYKHATFIHTEYSTHNTKAKKKKRVISCCSLAERMRFRGMCALPQSKSIVSGYQGNILKITTPVQKNLRGNMSEAISLPLSLALSCIGL